MEALYESAIEDSSRNALSMAPPAIQRAAVVSQLPCTGGNEHGTFTMRGTPMSEANNRAFRRAEQQLTAQVRDATRTLEQAASECFVRQMAVREQLCQACIAAGVWFDRWTTHETDAGHRVTTLTGVAGKELGRLVVEVDRENSRIRSYLAIVPDVLERIVWPPQPTN